jgi:hypothetical protein
LGDLDVDQSIPVGQSVFRQQSFADGGEIAISPEIEAQIVDTPWESGVVRLHLEQATALAVEDLIETVGKQETAIVGRNGVVFSLTGINNYSRSLSSIVFSGAYPNHGMANEYPPTCD